MEVGVNGIRGVLVQSHVEEEIKIELGLVTIQQNSMEGMTALLTERLATRLKIVTKALVTLVSITVSPNL